MRWTRPWWPLLVLGGYVAAALLFTWPLALHLTTAIPGDGKDGWQGAWDLWWVATALTSGRNPFHTDLLFHPGGADLYFHALVPFDGVLTLPVQLAAGPVAAYNAAILFSLVMCAWGMYWLARDRLARAGALPSGAWGELPPLAAGLLFGFSPYLADHLLSHLNLVAAEGLPFAVLALLRSAEGGGGLGWRDQGSGIRDQGSISGEQVAREADPSSPTPNPQRLPPRVPWRWIIGAALALLLTALCDWQYVLFLGLWTALWLFTRGVAWVWDYRQARTIHPHPQPPLPAGEGAQGTRIPHSAFPLLAWALFLLLVSPLALGMIRQLGQTAGTTFSGLAQDTLTYSADLVAYIIPSPFHPWWGAWAADLLRPLPGTLIEKVMFPTYTALVLAALGWIGGRRRGWPVGLWAATVGAFFVLSLGPTLHVAGQSWPVPLPAALLYQLPIANLTRAPGRFVVLVLLGLAMLVAFGLAAVLTRGLGVGGWGLARRDQGSGARGQGSEEQIPTPNPPPPTPRRVVALVALGLLGLELWTAPYRLAPWDAPPATATLATLPPGMAVFDVPVRPFESSYMQAQIVHQHPLIGGYLARAPIYPLLDGVPVFTQFQTLDDAPDLCAPPLDGLGPSIFTYFTTGALVLHKDKLDDRGLTAARALAARAGLGAPTLEDDRLVIYRPPLTATLAPWANVDTTTWYPRETGTGGAPLRWMDTVGTIHIWRPTTVAATLRLQAMSFYQSRRFTVTVDGKTQPVITFGTAPGPLVIPLPADAGHTVITVRALDPTTAPVSVGIGTDTRLLSLALVGCTLDLGP